jgi:hydrogenase maturation protein HypF
MINKRINAPLTSSLGRLFDGVASLVGLRNEVAFEGQAAMELEMTADAADRWADGYDLESGDGSSAEISTAPIIRDVVGDLLQGMPPGVVSARFHATLVRLFGDVCERLRRDTGLTRVVLSGGVFQNALLLKKMVHALSGNKFKVYTHKLVPANDGGLSLGQAVVAAARAAGYQNDRGPGQASDERALWAQNTGICLS